jgi:membrane protease YdiL (CAAX protease family)
MPWDFLLIFLFLGVIVPWRGRVRLRQLLALPVVGTVERLTLYASTIAFQWLTVAVVAWRLWAHGYAPAALGLVIHNRTRTVLAALAGSAILGLLHTLNLRRMGRSPEKLPVSLRALSERVLPQSSLELLPYLALAVTAGLCEEFLYRGFVMAALAHAGIPGWGTVLLSSILFGLAHLYQGRGGLLGTLLIGAVFGTARIAYDGLAAVVLWHITVDVVAGVAGPRYLVKSDAIASERKI